MKKVLTLAVNIKNSIVSITELKFPELDEALRNGYKVEDVRYSSPFGENNSSVIITYLLDKANSKYFGYAV